MDLRAEEALVGGERADRSPAEEEYEVLGMAIVRDLEVGVLS